MKVQNSWLILKLYLFSI